jgi:hypothetical protein
MGMVVDTVIPLAALYAVNFLFLLAMNVALLLKLRSVIPQRSRVSPVLGRHPSESRANDEERSAGLGSGDGVAPPASINRLRIAYRKE